MLKKVLKDANFLKKGLKKGNLFIKVTQKINFVKKNKKSTQKSSLKSYFSPEFSKKNKTLKKVELFLLICGTLDFFQFLAIFYNQQAQNPRRCAISLQ